MKIKAYLVTPQIGEPIIIHTTSLQRAANQFFGVGKAIKCMVPVGDWANHRHSKHNPSRTAKIVELK
jgi:hypothetical protein